MPSHTLGEIRVTATVIQSILQKLQGCTKKHFPGCVKFGGKVAFYLLTCCRQKHTKFSPLIHTTWEVPFIPALFAPDFKFVHLVTGQWYFVFRRRMRPLESVVFQQKLHPSAGPSLAFGQCPNC